MLLAGLPYGGDMYILYGSDMYILYGNGKTFTEINASQ